jgi:hypothetical protein
MTDQEVRQHLDWIDRGVADHDWLRVKAALAEMRAALAPVATQAVDPVEEKPSEAVSEPSVEAV